MFRNFTWSFYIKYQVITFSVPIGVGYRYGEEYIPAERQLYVSKVKNAQEAHEAIRPTDISRLPCKQTFLLKQFTFEKGIDCLRKYIPTSTILKLTIICMRMHLFMASIFDNDKKQKRLLA
jgi:hypothetical protein